MIKKIIHAIYSYKPIKKYLSKILFNLKNGPSVDPKFINTNKGFGYFMLSADFELGWAFRYAKMINPITKANQSRDNFPLLLDIFEKNNIPITWATVGHLFLEECSKGDHEWMHKIPYFCNRNWSFDKGNWFDCDPYTNYISDPQWYAPDLIDRILNSKVKHEIGCHTFSHIDFSDKLCTKEVAQDEISACIDVAKKWNIELKSFVAPGGTLGNMNVLVENNFSNYRKTIDYELSLPIIDDTGLVMIPTCVGLDDNGLGWSKEYTLRRLKRYVNKAIDTGTLCHFWFHPSLDSKYMNDIFMELIRYVKLKVDEGKIKVVTMQEMAKLTLDNKI